MATRDPSASYEELTRPELGRQLRALRLDVVYERALGDQLERREAGETIFVTDFVGGYGATFFGHNHPSLRHAMMRALIDRAPFATQASVRPGTAELAERLHARALDDLGQPYRVLLSNTGSEAVEAALKHAELGYLRRLEATQARFERAVERAARALSVGATIAKTARFELGLGADEADVGLISALRERFVETVNRLRPTLVAMQRGYHGMTLGALRLTHCADYRAPFERLLGRTVFVPFGDERALEDALRRERLAVAWPTVTHGRVELRARSISMVSALFMEPIQGEGGVHVCSPRYAQLARRLADEDGFDLVFDEIQCGMGRTGSFFFAEHLGVAPDTLLLSKSLGGGLAKISAALFDRARHQPEIGILHSSTFAEDEASCAVAIASLDLIEGPTAPMTRARDTGARLRAGLNAVAARHPSVVRAVRGAGLMLGVALDAPAGPTLRALASQGLLGYAAGGYLLREHDLRVMPCVSAPDVLRIEPSAYLSERDADYFVNAVEQLAQILERGDAYALLRYLVGAEDPKAPAVPRELAPRSGPPRVDRSRSAPPRVAFLTYFLDPAHMERWDASLGRFSSEERRRLVGQLFREAEPVLVACQPVRSATGAEIELRAYGIFVDAETFHASLRGKDRPLLRAKIERAIGRAAQDGCAVAALGGLTSVITANGRDVSVPGIAVTSGNSLTVAACLDAALSEARRRGLELSESVGAVVGAGGNIGSVYAELISDEVAELVLVSREGREQSLRPTARRILARALARAIAGSTHGLAGTLRERAAVREMLASEPSPVHVEALVASLMDDRSSPVRVTSDRNELRRAALILGASNAPHPLITPGHIGPGQVVLVDVAVPPDVDPAVRDLGSRVAVLAGGSMSLGPLNQGFDIAAPLPAGHLYACATEGVVLGLEQRAESFTLGAIDPERAKEILRLARRHGFAPAGSASPTAHSARPSNRPGSP